MVADTPASRDRVVDAARALCIVVVTLWHWTLSVNHRTADGSLAMPNPIDAVPGGWLATWVLQIMPVFFLVGGYANLVGSAAGPGTRDDRQPVRPGPVAPSCCGRPPSGPWSGSPAS
ncbi:hypothetical protein ACFSTC_19680 [Nonomuraea ferruginea]